MASKATLGVVFLAPLALGFAGLGLRLGLSGIGPSTHGASEPTTSGLWVLACFVVAVLLVAGWIVCIVRVVMTRRRDDEPVPRATVRRRIT